MIFKNKWTKIIDKYRNKSKQNTIKKQQITKLRKHVKQILSIAAFDCQENTNEEMLNYWNKT